MLCVPAAGVEARGEKGVRFWLKRGECRSLLASCLSIGGGCCLGVRDAQHARFFFLLRAAKFVMCCGMLPRERARGALEKTKIVPICLGLGNKAVTKYYRKQKRRAGGAMPGGGGLAGDRGQRGQGLACHLLPLPHDVLRPGVGWGSWPLLTAYDENIRVYPLFPAPFPPYLQRVVTSKKYLR